MKKTNTPAKLMLKLETVKAMTAPDLKQVVGGAAAPHARPTTTVLHTFDC